jgi:hypothetical protein
MATHAFAANPVTVPSAMMIAAVIPTAVVTLIAGLFRLIMLRGNVREFRSSRKPTELRAEILRSSRRVHNLPSWAEKLALTCADAAFLCWAWTSAAQ